MLQNPNLLIVGPFIVSHGFIQDGALDEVLHLCKHLCNLVGWQKVPVFTKG